MEEDKDRVIADLRHAIAVQSESLRRMAEERDRLRMAWNHLRATFAEMNDAIP